MTGSHIASPVEGESVVPQQDIIALRTGLKITRKHLQRRLHGRKELMKPSSMKCAFHDGQATPGRSLTRYD